MEPQPDNSPLADPQEPLEVGVPYQSESLEPPPQREPFWGWLDLLVVFGLLIAMILVILFAAAGATLALPRLKNDPTPLLFPTQLAFYVAIYLAFQLALRLRYDKPVFSSLGWQRTTSPRILVLIGLGGMCLSPLVSGVATLFHTPEVHMDILDQLNDKPVILALFGVMAITIAPLFEELLFRGFLQPLFCRTLGVVAGIALTSLIFGSLHAFQYKFVWQYVAAVSLVGAVLGIVRYRTNSIIPSTVMHACYNSVAVVGIFFQHK